jgi:hypothetical protein
VPAFEILQIKGRNSLPVHLRVRTRVFSVLVSGFEFSYEIDQDLDLVASLYQFAVLANTKQVKLSTSFDLKTAGPWTPAIGSRRDLGTATTDPLRPDGLVNSCESVWLLQRQRVPIMPVSASLDFRWHSISV